MYCGTFIKTNRYITVLVCAAACRFSFHSWNCFKVVPDTALQGRRPNNGRLRFPSFLCIHYFLVECIYRADTWQKTVLATDLLEVEQPIQLICGRTLLLLEWNICTKKKMLLFYYVYWMKYFTLFFVIYCSFYLNLLFSL